VQFVLVGVTAEGTACTDCVKDKNSSGHPDGDFSRAFASMDGCRRAASRLCAPDDSPLDVISFLTYLLP
jgi:hypothetical protein